MKTWYATAALSALLVMMAGCSHCRMPWQRTVTASMPPATYPCGPAGPAAVVPGDACGTPTLSGPVTTTVVPGAVTPGAVLTPTPNAAAPPALPGPQTYAPTTPGTVPVQ